MNHEHGLDDTSDDARRILHERYASMTPAEKLRRVSELTLSVNELALAGLAARHPGESRHQLLLRLARMRLGDDLIDRAYAAHHGAALPEPIAAARLVVAILDRLGVA